MAISKAKKETLVADLTALLADAKLTAYARYQGLTVADLQDLRRAAREAGVKIKVVKNRLVRVAMNEIAVYKDTDTTGLTGQLVYAISDTDEVAPAKVLAAFAKTHPALELLGGFNDLGHTLNQAEISRSPIPSLVPAACSLASSLVSKPSSKPKLATPINSNHSVKEPLWLQISRNWLRNWSI